MRCRSTQSRSIVETYLLVDCGALMCQLVYSHPQTIVSNESLSVKFSIIADVSEKS